MQTLKQELKLVSEVAPRGSHSQVSKACGISTEYLYQIRAGINATRDTLENRQLYQKLISAYRSIIRDAQKRFSAI